jgi:hypothetical protein
MPPMLAKPGLNQLIAIIQLYQAQAIAAVNPDLPIIYEFHKGPKMRTAFPWLTLGFDGITFGEASQGTRSQMQSFELILDSGNYDSEYAQDQAIDYMRVLDQIIMSMSQQNKFLTDWETALPIQQETVPSGITIPYTQGSVKEVFIEHESQSAVDAPDQEVPIMQIMMRIRIDVEEIWP